MNNNHWLSILFVVLALAPSTSQCQELQALPAPQGIWVNAREIYDPASSIAISRKSGAGLEALASLKAPSSLEEFLATYEQSLEAQPANEYVADTTLMAIWARFSKYRQIDSLGLHVGNLHVLAGLGAAWFDGEAEKGRSYSYEGVSGRTKRSYTSHSVSYPQRVQMGTISPVLIQPMEGGVHLKFKVINPGVMRSCKIYRSYYMRSGPELIAPLVMFNNKAGVNYIIFTDYTAVPKVPYTYTVVPVDAAGNAGTPSQPATLFNTPANSVPPSVRHLAASSVEEKKAIRLSWLPPSTPDVISVELYRSKEYAGLYSRVASLRPDDTTFLDYDVDPVTTYYYTASINGTYEHSVNTPRVPGILRASRKSHVGPMNLTAVRDGNIARLEWERSEDDSRGYYLYRGTGYHGELKKIRAIILSKDSAVSYVDTLPVTMKTTVYTYAVTSENTSYNESPLSDRASFQYVSGSNSLPVVTDVSVIPSADGSLRVMWTNLSENGLVEGYKLYRAVKDEHGNKIETLKPVALTLPARMNFYADGNVKEGFTYTYAVTAINGSGSEGSISAESGYTIPVRYPIQVSDIQAFSGDQQVKLLWNVPQGMALKKIDLLRAETDAAPKLVISLEPGVNTYVDKDVKKGTTYHYYFITRSASDRTSQPTVPVSAIVD
jgi:hypothetical protein